MRTSPFQVAALAFVLLTASHASAATVFVADDCAGQPTPCTTDFQSALDDSTYQRVEIVSNAVINGDYKIDRPLLLVGQTGAQIKQTSASPYALRVENTSSVDVRTVDIIGRVAVQGSDDVLFYKIDISQTDIGVQILDSNDVTLRLSTIDATSRGVDATDSTAVDLIGSAVDSGDYGVVLSSAGVDVTDGSVHGDLYAFILQKGAGSRPDLDASDADVSSGVGQDTTWRWTEGLARYISCAPSPTERIVTDDDLVGLVGYTGWGGE